MEKMLERAFQIGKLCGILESAILLPNHIESREKIGAALKLLEDQRHDISNDNLVRVASKLLLASNLLPNVGVNSLGEILSLASKRIGNLAL
ncbi:MAG: hypothetical protein HYY55_03280 [Candidatus Niyogibacteria bacterium]|nr:MAG: hypothetical protein HYY55_03280 [Candidatus Niyogibacteria bacterium]